MIPRTTIRKLAAGMVAAILVTTAPLAGADDPGYSRIDSEIAGSPYVLVRPEYWNGDLVLLVHGTINDTFEALAPGFLAQGYGVAFSALPAGLGDGFALKRIPLDTRKVQAKFTAAYGAPARTYLVGFSRGAHAMQRLLESAPSRYDGMLSLCGGNGGSTMAWNHFFTARVLFDHYFPGVLPGTATSMPPMDLATYTNNLAPVVAGAVIANIPAAMQMAAVEQFDLPYNSIPELVSGIAESLAIHSVGVHDIIAAARGLPFDNASVYYTGTADDAGLNASVLRLVADPQAANYLRTWYEPNGIIGATPTLLLHTARDGIVPETSNNDKYEDLVNWSGGGDYLVRRVLDKAGHCNFTPVDIYGSFGELVAWVEYGIKPSSSQ